MFSRLFILLTFALPAWAADTPKCGPELYAEFAGPNGLHLTRALAQVKNQKEFPYSQAPGRWLHLPKTGGFRGESIHYMVNQAKTQKPKGTLYLLGGLNFNAERWDASGLVTELNRRGYDVIRVDVPGQGWTFLHELHGKDKIPWSRAGEPYAHEYSADIVAQLLKELRKDGTVRTPDVTGMGISYGGWLWASTVQRHPEAVERLILLAPGSESLHRTTLLGGFEDSLDQTRRWMPIATPWVNMVENMFYRPQLEATLRQGMHDNFFTYFPQLKDDPLLADGGTRLFLGIYQFRGDQALSGMRLPGGVHMVIPGEDEIIPVSQYKKLQEALQSSPRNSHEVVPGSHHDLTNGSPEQIKNLADRLELLARPEKSGR